MKKGLVRNGTPTVYVDDSVTSSESKYILRKIRHEMLEQDFTIIEETVSGDTNGGKTTEENQEG